MDNKNYNDLHCGFNSSKKIIGIFLETYIRNKKLYRVFDILLYIYFTISYFNNFTTFHIELFKLFELLPNHRVADHSKNMNYDNILSEAIWLLYFLCLKYVAHSSLRKLIFLLLQHMKFYITL